MVFAFGNLWRKGDRESGGVGGVLLQVGSPSTSRTASRAAVASSVDVDLEIGAGGALGVPDELAELAGCVALCVMGMTVLLGVLVLLGAPRGSDGFFPALLRPSGNLPRVVSFDGTAPDPGPDAPGAGLLAAVPKYKRTDSSGLLEGSPKPLGF